MISPVRLLLLSLINLTRVAHLDTDTITQFDFCRVILAFYLIAFKRMIFAQLLTLSAPQNYSSFIVGLHDVARRSYLSYELYDINNNKLVHT